MSKTGGKYIIIENDSPRYVIMDFDEFKKMTNGKSNASEGGSTHPDNDNEMINVVNADIAASNNNIGLPESVNILNTENVEEKGAGEIKIEDLPF